MSKIIILGGGVAGYNAAIKLSKNNEVILIEKEEIGGTCLNKGCIPTKLFFENMNKDINQLNEKKEKVITDLRNNLHFLIKNKKIDYHKDEAKIISENSVYLKNSEKFLDFDKLILAIGSKPSIPEIFKEKSNVITSNEALNLKEVPKSITIIGSGYIGIEFATILSNLGSQVTLIEKEKTILPLIDREATEVLEGLLIKKRINILTGKEIREIKSGNIYFLDGEEIPAQKILLCVGREAVHLDSDIFIEREENFIKTNEFFETSQKNIFAIGDCTKGPLLAHRAVYDSEVLCENIINEKRKKREYESIPFCIFSEPMIAGIGKMDELKIVKIPFSVLGKSYCDDSTEGFLKIGINEDSKIKAALVVNKNALEILSALTVIVNLDSDIDKISNIVFFHPSSSEIIPKILKKLKRLSEDGFRK